jgi:hypothetical protein
MPVALAAVTLILHVATNRGYHVFRDELYYLACGRHLAWGYVDHPPLVAVLARAETALLGSSTAGLRFLSAVAGALTVLLTGLTAGVLGGRRFAQSLACVCAIVAPVYLENFTIFTMNSFDFLFWTTMIYLLARLLRGDDGRLWVWFGVVAGIGLLNKHSVLYLLAGVLVGLLLTPARRHLTRAPVWIGAMVALALFAPHVLWQVQHGWPTLEFMRNAQAEKNVHVSVLAFLLGQILIHLPLTAPIWLAGLGYLLLAKHTAPFRALGWIYLFCFALLSLSGAKLYYLSPAYPVLFAAGGVAVERGSEGTRWRWLRPATIAVLVIGGAVFAPIVLPILPPARLEAYMQRIGFKPVLMEHHRAPRLTQTFADEFGWEEMVAKVAKVYAALPPEERARCGIFCSNYGEAGAIDYYGPKYGLPPAASGHNSYWLWGPPSGRGEVIITVGESEEDVAKTYRDVQVVDRTDNEWCMPFENDQPIIVGRQPKDALKAIWPRCKRFI